MIKKQWGWGCFLGFVKTEKLKTEIVLKLKVHQYLILPFGALRGYEDRVPALLNTINTVKFWKNYNKKCKKKKFIKKRNSKRKTNISLLMIITGECLTHL